MAGWVKKAENKAKAQQSWGSGFAELGKKLQLIAISYIPPSSKVEAPCCDQSKKIVFKKILNKLILKSIDNIIALPLSERISDN